MANNTYKLPESQGSGLFGWLDRFLRIDATISQVIHVRFLPQILFVTLLSVFYIGNRHYADKTIREITVLEREVDELRADYMTLKADYMLATKRSEVAGNARKIGLQKSEVPPLKILVPKQ